MTEYTGIYQLVEILDHQGRSKLEVDREVQEKYRRWIGCYTKSMRLNTPYGYEGFECLYVQFEQDSRGVHTSQRLRTSPIQNIETAGDGIRFITTNSVYIFKKAQFIEPPIRSKEDIEGDANLLELWFGQGPYLFDKGIHYGSDLHAHMLTTYCHSGTMRDSYIISHWDSPSHAVARYFMSHSSIKFYDTLYRQQDYPCAIMIHNTSDWPLTIKFQFSDDQWIIEPHNQKLIQPPIRRRRRREV